MNKFGLLMFFLGGMTLYCPAADSFKVGNLHHTKQAKRLIHGGNWPFKSDFFFW